MIRVPATKPGSKALIACSIIFALIPTVFVALRVAARRIANRRLDAADYLIFFAWLFTVSLAIVCVLEAFYGGFGWHRLEIIALYTEQVIVQYHIMVMPLEIFYTLSVNLSKMSLLILYIKVFPPTRLTIVSKITFVIVGVLAVGAVLATLLICQPIQANWYLDTPGRHCGSQKLAIGVFGVTNVMTDIMTLGLPIPSLLKLKLPQLKKFGLVATFAIGFLTCVASIIRLVFLTSMDAFDVTYSGIEFIIMSVVEPSLAVSLACVPLLRPLVSRGDSRYSDTGTRENNMNNNNINNNDAAGGAVNTVGGSGRSHQHHHHKHQNSASQGSDNSRRLMRGRSSCASVPAHVLQYHYEMGKDGVELLTTNGGSEYQYQAEITGGAWPGPESDGGCSSGLGMKRKMEEDEDDEEEENDDDDDVGHDGLEIRGGDGANIVIRQEWIVSNERRKMSDDSLC